MEAVGPVGALGASRAAGEPHRGVCVTDTCASALRYAVVPALSVSASYRHNIADCAPPQHDDPCADVGSAPTWTCACACVRLLWAVCG